MVAQSQSAPWGLTRPSTRHNSRTGRWSGYIRRWLWVSVLLVLLAQAAPPVRAAVVVSSKLSSESAMIGQMIRLLLNAHGIPATDRTALGATPVVRKALIAGEIDLYVEYTGNAGFFFNVSADPAWKDLQQGYALGSRLDYTANRIVWLTPANASNAGHWPCAATSPTANHLETMSDFARWVGAGGKVVLACSAEFANAGTLRSLEKTYGFAMRPDQLIVLAGGETSATIAAAAAGTNGTNTAMVYGTDGGIVAAGLRVLEDDRHDQPVYAPVPTIREAVLKANPQIADLVLPLMEDSTRRRSASSMRASRSMANPRHAWRRTICSRGATCIEGAQITGLVVTHRPARRGARRRWRSWRCSGCRSWSPRPIASCQDTRWESSRPCRRPTRSLACWHCWSLRSPHWDAGIRAGDWRRPAGRAGRIVRCRRRGGCADPDRQPCGARRARRRLLDPAAERWGCSPPMRSRDCSPARWRVRSRCCWPQASPWRRWRTAPSTICP